MIIYQSKNIYLKCTFLVRNECYSCKMCTVNKHKRGHTHNLVHYLKNELHMVSCYSCDCLNTTVNHVSWKVGL